MYHLISVQQVLFILNKIFIKLQNWLTFSLKFKRRIYNLMIHLLEPNAILVLIKFSLIRQIVKFNTQINFRHDHNIFLWAFYNLNIIICLTVVRQQQKNSNYFRLKILDKPISGKCLFACSLDCLSTTGAFETDCL
ncbi:hypothetical protein ACJX0J_005672 [Zea mays]